MSEPRRNVPGNVEQQQQRDIEAFRDAVSRDDVATVTELLRVPHVRERVDAPMFAFGQRAAHIAAKHKPMLEALITAGANVNLKSEWENGPYTVLDNATEETARFLLARGVTLTPNVAARLGWIGELRELLVADPACVHARGGDGQQPLHEAATVAIADLLIEHGADVNVRCIDHKSTPAQYALAERPDVCRRLLERGADADVFMPARLGDVALAARLLDADPQAVAARINEPGYAPVPPLHIYCWTLGFGLSPHDVALKFGHGDVRELLVRRSPPRVRFVNAVVAGDEAAARALLDQDPSVLASPSHAEHSLLAHAIFGGRREAAHLMLRLGFDETAGGVDGGNALHARRAGWATSSSSTCCSGAGACRSTVAIPSTSARRSVGQRSGRSTAARAGETILRSSIDSSLLERTSRHREMVRADR
ncbi:MAG TPA: ankyrin repeat domain-containing protein [Vicinamibacterales bacterium]|jgi:ankyrin repeat protein